MHVVLMFGTWFFCSSCTRTTRKQKKKTRQGQSDHRIDFGTVMGKNVAWIYNIRYKKFATYTHITRYFLCFAKRSEKNLKKSKPTCQIIQETTPFTDQRTFHPLPPKHLSPPTHRPQLGAVLPLCYY